jgi:hypothetical protein
MRTRILPGCVLRHNAISPRERIEPVCGSWVKDLGHPHHPLTAFSLGAG